MAAKASQVAVADRRTMYPPEAGLRAGDSIVEQLASQERETLAPLKAGVVGDSAVLQAATANASYSWFPRFEDCAAQPGVARSQYFIVPRSTAI